MKKLSIYILFSVTILILMICFDLVFQYHTTSRYYAADFEQRADRLAKAAGVAEHLARTPDGLEVLSGYLNAQMGSQQIDFWVILHGDNIVSSGQRFEIGEALGSQLFDLSHGPRDLVYDKNDVTVYCWTPLPAGLRLVVGLSKAKEGYLKLEMELIASGILRFLAGMMVICVGTFVFFFRDIMRSIRQLTGQSRHRTFESRLSLSKEADLLARGLAAYDSHAEELRKQKDLYRWQVLPSLRSELESGLVPPYEFACTLVRSDINNFTKIYNAHSVADFMSTINDFFSEVTHIVSRYGGYIHEFVGDEVIYYFKDDEVGNSTVVALSALYDINRAAEIFHSKTMLERGYPFTIKSSVAHDRLRFGRLVNAHSLSGPSLIETVRILSNVTEKDGNVVVFDVRHCEALPGFLATEFYSDVTLKGFSEERRLYSLREKKPVQDHFAWDEERKWKNLSYYRSDADLEAVIDWLRRSWSDAPVLDDVLHVIGQLRPLAVTGSNLQALQVLKSWLGDLIAISENDSRFRDGSRILASAIRLIENFACEVENPREKGALMDLLESASRHSDRRVTANAVEALSTLRILPAERLEALTNHIDNRVAANALVGAGKREITPLVVKELSKMLGSKNHWRVASGLYALGEIAFHHRRQNTVYYETQVQFLALVAELPRFAAHEFEGIRRQALLAARKVDDPGVLQSLPGSINKVS